MDPRDEGAPPARILAEAQQRADAIVVAPEAREELQRVSVRGVGPTGGDAPSARALSAAFMACISPSSRVMNGFRCSHRASSRANGDAASRRSSATLGAHRMAGRIVKEIVRGAERFPAASIAVTTKR